MQDRPYQGRKPSSVSRVSSSQLSLIMKDMRLAKTLKLDIETGAIEMALDSLRERRDNEVDPMTKRVSWFSDVIDALFRNDRKKAVEILSDVAWLRQMELEMLTNPARHQ